MNAWNPPDPGDLLDVIYPEPSTAPETDGIPF
jgi:hypothetical protein